MSTAKTHKCSRCNRRMEASKVKLKKFWMDKRWVCKDMKGCTSHILKVIEKPNFKW